MRITMAGEEIEFIEGAPALRIENALVVSDLHLGFEGIMADRGIFLPKVQYKIMMRQLEQLSTKKVSTLLIDGDIKHEFSETSYHEFKEVRDLIIWAKEEFERVVLIKGNHDNHIARVTMRYGIELYDEFVLGKFKFVHGHKPFSLLKDGVTIMGHEHPSIALFDDIGVKEKVKAFLYGLIEGEGLIVMPAMSYFAYGTDVNIIPREELLSPILKSRGVDDMLALGVVEEEGLIDLPIVKRMRI
jgi:hypothetical protein